MTPRTNREAMLLFCFYKVSIILILRLWDTAKTSAKEIILPYIPKADVEDYFVFFASFLLHFFDRSEM